MKNKILIALVVISFGYGLLVGSKKIFPYELIKQIKHSILPVNENTNFNEKQELKIDDFKTHKGNTLPKILMLGDSITSDCLSWNELLGRNDVINKGIAGDTTFGILKRLDTLNPGSIDKAFIMIGVNDIFTQIDNKAIFENYKKIIQFLVDSNIEPIIQSTLFTSSYIEDNKKILELNKLLREYAKENGIKFINTNSKLSKDNQLINEYTTDGVHLNEKGYVAWKDMILPFL